jgi:hypothetical protein
MGGVGVGGDGRAGGVVAPVASVARCFGGWRSAGGRRLEQAADRSEVATREGASRASLSRGQGDRGGGGRLLLCGREKNEERIKIP